MTAKEKANSLVSQYFVLITNLPFKETCIEIHKNDFDKSKQCAKIAVDEIILSNPMINAKYEKYDCVWYRDESNITYWVEVLKEIDLI